MYVPSGILTEDLIVDIDNPSVADIGALIIAYTILWVPFLEYSVVYPTTLF